MIDPDGSTVLATSGLLEQNTWYVVRVETRTSTPAWYADIDGVSLGSGALSVARAIDEIVFYNFVSSADGDADFFFDDVGFSTLLSNLPVAGKVIAAQGTIADETPTYSAWTITSANGQIEAVWSPASSNLAESPGTGDSLAHTMNTVDVSERVPGAVLLNQPNTGATVQLQGGTAGSGETNQAWGQSFTPSSSVIVGAIGLGIIDPSSDYPTDFLYIELVSGSIDGTVIGTSSSVHQHRIQHGGGASVPATAWYAPFTTAVSLSASTQYFFRVFRTGARDTTNDYTLRRASSDILSGQSSYVRDNNTWISSSANDLTFILYGDGGIINPTDTINQAKVGVAAFRSSGSGRTHEIRRRLNTTDTDTAVTLTATEAYYQTALFTGIDLNLAQIGGEKSGGAGGRSMSINEAWIMIHYTPAAAASATNFLALLGVGF